MDKKRFYTRKQCLYAIKLLSTTRKLGFHKLQSFFFPSTESKNNLLQLSSMIQTDLHMTCLQWVRLGADDKIQMAQKVELPVYLNATRADLLFTVILTCEKGLTADHVYERGVALLSTTIA